RIVAALVTLFPLNDDGEYPCSNASANGSTPAIVLIVLAVIFAARAFAHAGITLPSALQYWKPRGKPPADPSEADRTYLWLCRQSTQNCFLVKCLLPVFLSAVCFTVGWAWIENRAPDLSKFWFIVPVV